MSGESTDGLQIVEAFQLLGTLGGLITLVALLHKAWSTNRAKRLWGNLKRTTIHRIYFSHGWGYHGEVMYEAVNNQLLWSEKRSRFRKLLSKLQPDYVIITVPDEAGITQALVFTEMRILWRREGAQLEFTYEFREPIIQREHFLAIGFRAMGMDRQATSWSQSHEMQEGWDLPAASNRIAVSLSESARILSAFPETGTLSVEVLGFRDGVMGSVGRFDLSKALNTPAKSWARYLATSDSFGAHIGRDEPTDADAVFRYVSRRASAEGGIGKPPPERRVALGFGTGRRIVTEEDDTNKKPDRA